MVDVLLGKDIKQQRIKTNANYTMNAIKKVKLTEMEVNMVVIVMGK